MIERGRVTRTYKVTDGAVLAQDLTSSWNDGDSVQVEAATDFSPAGGDGVFMDSPHSDSGEVFSYSGIKINTSDSLTAPDLILGVTRSNPVAHAKGTWIQEGEEPYVEKLCDIDFGDGIFSGVPVDASVYTLFHLGTFSDDESSVVPVETTEEGFMRVIGGAAGAVPLVGADIETLPPTGDGDGSLPPVEGPGGVMPPPGQGWEDGAPPADAPTVTAVGGIGQIHVRIESIANSSAVTYNVHVHTTTGFTPAADTLAGTIRLAGTPGYLPLLVIKDFPSDHVLDGTPADPPNAETEYFVVVIPSDGSGEGPASAEVSVTPVKVGTVLIDNGAITEALIAANAVTVTKIADDSVSTPKLIAGSVQAAKIATGAIETDKLAANAVTVDKLAANSVTSEKIVAGTIVAGDIAAGTITGDKIAADTITGTNIAGENLSAIFADLGTITAGTLTSVTINTSTLTGVSLRTAGSGVNRIELGPNYYGTQAIGFLSSSDAALGEVKWYGSPFNRLSVDALLGELYLHGQNGVLLASATKVTGDLELDGALNHDGTTVGFYGVTPVTRPSMTNLGGSDSTTAQLHSKINNLLDNIRAVGLIS